MATNITINTVDFAALVVFQDGSHMAVDAHSSMSFQLVDKGFCTISEVADLGPDDLPTPDFIEEMIDFWQTYGPKATPL